MPDSTEPTPTIVPIPVSNEDYAQYNEDYTGICMGCRKWTGEMCEPDARKYQCPECRLFEVYGAEEALMHGFITITD